MIETGVTETVEDSPQITSVLPEKGKKLCLWGNPDGVGSRREGFPDPGLRTAVTI